MKNQIKISLIQHWFNQGTLNEQIIQMQCFLLYLNKNFYSGFYVEFILTLNQESRLWLSIEILIEKTYNQWTWHWLPTLLPGRLWCPQPPHIASYSESPATNLTKHLEVRGIEPLTSRMQSERSTPELNPRYFVNVVDLWNA